MKKYASFFFGLIPLACGWLINYLLLLPLPGYVHAVVMPILNAVLLYLWGLLAYKTTRYDRTAFTHTVKMNTLGLILLVLVLIQELILGGYWANLIGFSSQFYFLPCLSLGYRISGLFSFGAAQHTWFAYLLVFVLMFAASYIGSRFKKR